MGWFDDDQLKAELVAILAAFQSANQVSQQSGQNVNQSISDLLQNVAQSTGASTVESNVGDIGGDEDREQGLIQSGAHVEMNKKLTYDQHLYALMRNGDQSRTHFDQAIIDGQSDARATRTVVIEHLQNAVKIADLAAMNGLRDAGAITDRIINVDEQGYTAKDILADQTFKDGIKALMIATMSEIVTPDKSA